MSYQVCKNCDYVINNRIYYLDECPNCESLERELPGEADRDWDDLYKKQKQLSREEQITSIVKQVTKVIINYHCGDEYSREIAEKAFYAVGWMLETRSYREINLPILELMESALSLILDPDSYK